MVVLAFENALEAGDGVFQRHILAGGVGEHFRHGKRLRQELRDAPRPADGLLVLVGKLVHAENRDDVLEFLVALQHRLHAAGHIVVLLADDEGVELPRGGVERVHRRVNAKRGDIPGQHHLGVEVGEGGGGRGVGEVVRGDVDRLHRSDRARLGRGDALLQGAHFLGEGRLVAHGRRHAPEQRRHFGSGERVAVDVVDEEQHVAALVAELLGHRQAAQRHPQAVAGRLVHLAVHHRHLGFALEVDDAGFLHLVIEIVAFPGALADTGENRQPAVFGGDVVDQLEHVHGLADTGAAEQAHLAALGEGADEVDNLDAGFEQFVGDGQLLVARGLGVDRHALLFTDGAALVDGAAEHVHDAAEGFHPHGNRHRPAGVGDHQAPAQPLGAAEGDGAHHAVAELLLHFEGDVAVVDGEGVEHLGNTFPLELHVDDRADDLYDSTATHVFDPCA